MPGNPYTLPDSELTRLLAEDAPCGDATSFALGIGDRPGRLVFRARQAMVVCASEEARRMGELHGLRSVGEFVPAAAGSPPSPPSMPDFRKSVWPRPVASTPAMRPPMRVPVPPSWSPAPLIHPLRAMSR